MDDKLKRHIQCLIENVGLNATRHKDQERAMKEAKEVMEVIVKNYSIPIVSNCDAIFEQDAKLTQEEIEEDCRNIPN